MQRILAIIIAFLAWFALIAQLVLMLQSREVGIPETLVRFFSFFTILTNTLVALLYTGRLLNITITQKIGKLTAVTSYILIVGIVYQFLLRHLWHPTGLQWAVDELLHTAIPLLVTIFWYLFEEKSPLHYRQISGWLIYPLVYFVYVLLRGLSSGYYPYPFIDASKLGMGPALLNGLLILVFFVVVQVVLIIVAKRVK
jgi:hypothetical protein